MFLDYSRTKKSRIKLKFSRQRYQVQEPSPRAKIQVQVLKEAKKPNYYQPSQKRFRNPSKEVKVPNPISHQHDHHQVSIPSHVNPSTNCSHSGTRKPFITLSQESSGNTPSQASPESTLSQECPLSPGWVHAISTIMGYSLKSEIGQKLQKWVLYHDIANPTNLWLSWDPTDYEAIRLHHCTASSGEPLSNLSCTSMSNSGDWMNSLIYLRECQTPSRWHSFRMLLRTFPSSALLKHWMNTLLPPLGLITHLNYSSYYNLLINACVRYDATNTSTASKRRNVYAASGTQNFTIIEEPHETQFS